jgi:hypothetical protein
MSVGFSRCSVLSWRSVRLALSCLAVFAVCEIGYAQTSNSSKTGVAGQEVAKTLESLTAKPVTRIIHQYTAAFYSVLGPYNIKNATSTNLTFMGFPENPHGTTLDLTGKNVTIKTEGGQGSSSASLTPGARVLVCQKDNDIVIFLLTAHTSSSTNH